MKRKSEQNYVVVKPYIYSHNSKCPLYWPLLHLWLFCFLNVFLKRSFRFWISEIKVLNVEFTDITDSLRKKNTLTGFGMIFPVESDESTIDYVNPFE